MIQRTASFLMLVSSLPSGLSQNVSGWVTQCRGEWEDRSDPAKIAKIDCKAQATKLWHPFGRNPKLVRISTPKPGDSLTIRIARTGERHRFLCAAANNPCDPPPSIAKLIPTQPSKSLDSGFFASPGETYAQIRLMLSRSSKPDEKSPPVTADYALAKVNSVTLGNLIRPKTPAGDYLLELCPFDAQNRCPQDHNPTSVKWYPGDDPIAETRWPSAPSPPAGLYEIVRSIGPIRTPDRGFLLIVRPERWKDVEAQVKIGEALFLNEWKDKEEGRIMFRALLLHLAQAEK